MSGHSKWSTIKHKKGAADEKRGRLFSKLANAISIAAKSDPNPQFNSRLRAAIEKARESNVPAENIERAVRRAAESKNALKEILIEAYGPEGAALLIEAITDNSNRTISETKKILSDAGAKFAEPGAVVWAFENKNGRWEAKHRQELSAEGKKGLADLIEALEEQGDIQKIITNGHLGN